MKKRFSYILTLVFSFMLSTNVVLAAKSFDSKVKVKACGFSKIPSNLPAFTSGLYNLIKILVPVILIIMVMVDLISGVMADSEDGAKKSKKKIITRFIAAIVVFFVMSITQVIFKAVAKEDANGMSECINCVLNNKCTVSAVDLDIDIEFGKKTGESKASTGADSSWYDDVVKKWKDMQAEASKQSQNTSSTSSTQSGSTSTETQSDTDNLNCEMQCRNAGSGYTACMNSCKPSNAKSEEIRKQQALNKCKANCNNYKNSVAKEACKTTCTNRYNKSLMKYNTK